MPYTNQYFLVEVAISTSCSMHSQVVNFHIVMEIWLGLSLHIYFNSFTNLQKKFDFVIYARPLTLKKTLRQHEPILFCT